MLIPCKFLQDFPNSTKTLFVIGTPVKFNSFMLGAKYPILFISSFDMSVLYCKSKYSSFAFKIDIKFCSSMIVLGNFYFIYICTFKCLIYSPYFGGL